MTVRCRRSPAASRGWTDQSSVCGSLTGAFSEAPHSPQNFDPGALPALQRGQPRASALPHSEQNFPPIGFSIPQFEQRIEITQNLSDHRYLYHPAL